MLLMVAPTYSGAYCGPAPAPAELAARWNYDPVVLLALIALGGLFWIRGDTRARARVFQGAALAALALVFISPLCAASSALFSARALHHVLLVALAAPLYVLAGGHSPRLPLTFSASLHVGVMWLWHAPPLYTWALQDPAAYWVMELTLIVSAAAFWRNTLDSRSSALSAVVSAGAVSMLMGLLGALITFAPNALYAPHLTTTWAWDLTPLEDQQLAGLLTWTIGAGPYLACVLYRVAHLLSDRSRSAAPWPG